MIVLGPLRPSRAEPASAAKGLRVRHDERVIADRYRLIVDALGQSPRTILEIDYGYDFEVAIVDDDWVFRFPRRAGVEEALELEIVLLPLLAGVLPVNVPSFEHISRDPLFVGYRLIRGEPLVDEDAVGVRAFLEALHTIDPSRLPVQQLEWVEAYREQCAEFERLVLPSSTKTCARRQSVSSAARRPSWTSSLWSFTPTSVPSTYSCATAGSPA